MIEDSSLALPPPVVVEPPLVFPAVVRPPDVDGAAHIALAGPHIVAHGTAGAGIRQVLAFGLPVIRDLQIVNAREGGAVLSPLGLERRITIAGHEILERVHILDDRTAVIMEWARLDTPGMTDERTDAAPDDEPPRIHMQWRTGPAESVNGAPLPLRRQSASGMQARTLWHADETRLRVDFADPGATVCFRASPGTTRITAVPAPPGAALDCSLDARILPGQPVRLILTAAAGDDAAAALSPLPDVAGRIRARSAILRRRQREHIRLVSPDPDVDLAVEWAKQRIEWTGAFTPHAGLAALAAGEFALSREIIAILARQQSSRGDIPGAGPAGYALARKATEPGPDATAEWLLLVARHLAWTGELGLAQAVWPRVGVAIAWLSGSAVQAPSGRMLAHLALAAESVGDTDAIRDIEAMRAAADVAAPKVETVRFPASGVVACTADAGVAMAPLFALVDGLLGAAPDAVRGRLRLRPAAPATWERYQVSGLRMGEATIDLGYRRDGSSHEFRLEQPTGATPIRVVFEPVIPGRAIVAATVDDRPASLVPRPHSLGLVVPVQVVLDHERSIILDAID